MPPTPDVAECAGLPGRDGLGCRAFTTAKGLAMHASIRFTLVALTLSVASLGAQAKGCLKGAAVGGIGGHVAGHHGVIGAVAGCAVGRHLANKKDKQQQKAVQRSVQPLDTDRAPAKP